MQAVIKNTRLDLPKGSMQEWGHLLPIGMLRNVFCAPRLSRFVNIRKYNLPAPPFILDSLERIGSSDTLDALSELGSHGLYVLFENQGRNDGPIYSRFRMAPQQVQNMARCWSKRYGEGYWGIVQRQVTLSFQGTVLISEDGAMIGEMVQDNLLGITRGVQTPTMNFRCNRFLDSLSYSFNDQSLRAAVWRLLKYLPSHSQFDKLSYNPGYYEFGLTKNTLSPVFFDMRDDLCFPSLDRHLAIPDGGIV